MLGSTRMMNGGRFLHPGQELFNVLDRLSFGQESEDHFKVIEGILVGSFGHDDEAIECCTGFSALLCVCKHPVVTTNNETMAFG